MPSPKSVTDRLLELEAQISAMKKELTALSKKAMAVGKQFQQVQDKKKVALIKSRIGQP